MRLIVVDEAYLHHDAHTSLFVEAGKGAQVVGLTATPLREDLRQHYQTIVCGPTPRELTAPGVLVPALAYAPKAEELNHALIRSKPCGATSKNQSSPS